MKNIRNHGRVRIYAVILTLCFLITTMSGPWVPVRAATQADFLDPEISTVLSQVKTYMLAHDTNPDLSSTWNVIGLQRSGLSVPSSYINTYYTNVIKELESKSWVLTKTKYSDYSKLILGLTSVGVDATNVCGHNLFQYLSNFTDVKRQGFNGPIWALIALNSNPNYSIPYDSSLSDPTTKEGLIQYLVKGQTSDGGWTLSGDTADSDMTGMTIQALAPYYGVSGREDVTAAIDKALIWISDNQLSSGGYATMGSETEESCAQMIVALSALGIDSSTDSRFIKNGKWPMTGLFQYYLSQGGFMHVAAGASNNGGGTGGTLDGMATEQGMYATVAYDRMTGGYTSLYDMSDIPLSAGVMPAGINSGSTTATTADTSSQTTSVSKVKVISVALNYSSITVTKGKTKKLTAIVTPSNATNGKLTWSSANKKIAKVNSNGKVTGVKAGTTKITAKAKDGSGKKAVCSVTVSAAASSSTTTTKAKTKTVTSSTHAATKTVSVATTAAQGTTKSVNGQAAAGTSGQSGKSTSAESTTESGGWSFTGADYVAGSSGEVSDSGELTSTGEENQSEANGSGEKWYNIPVPLWVVIIIGVGFVELEVLIGILVFLRKRGLLHLPLFNDKEDI